MYQFQEEKKFQQLTEKNKSYLNIIAGLRAALIILAIILLICYFTTNWQIHYLILAIVVLVVFIISIPVTNKYYLDKRYLENVNLAYLRHYARREGKTSNNKGFFDKGSEFKREFSKTSLRDKYLLEDIEVFGKNSLYEILSSAKSVLGRYAFADSLCHGFDYSIKRNKENFASKAQILGNSEDIIKLEASLAFNKINQNVERETYVEDLSLKYSAKPKLSLGLIAIYIFDVLCLVLAGLSIIPLPTIILPFILNLYYATLFRDRLNTLAVNDIYDSIEANKYVLAYLAKLNLTYLDEKYTKEYFLTALKRFKRLSSLWQVLAYKNNLLFKIIFNGLICFEGLFQLLFNRLQIKESEIEEILGSIAQLENLASYANLACDYDSCLAQKGEELSFNDLNNILIKDCVTNSFSYTKGTIITGSNMSGKTTFLRTIAEAILLNNACGIVPATSFIAPNYMLYTALRIKDDLASGISSFYAEIEKIKEMLEDKTEFKKLCLIDEIFKGTNTLDRIYGAKMLIKKLEELKYDFIISTHDFELCEVPTIINYHFSETYLNEYRDIYFDYKIKEGKSQSTNAIFLLKRSGIIN